jgi:predicted nuclease of restriction endonuclease-like (RecB) superfamily
VIGRLAHDLRAAFPDVRGFSARNLGYMKALAKAWPDEAILQAVLAKLPWYHNLTLLERVERLDERLWYARQAIEHGWSRQVLRGQIERGLFARMGKALTNFERTLPPPQSRLAAETLKDPCAFDFLSATDDAAEAALERGLIEHLRKFLLELGQGFAFVGSQHPLEVGGQDFRIDLLFYHYRLHCFVVIDLKTRDFEPEFAGKMSFYLSAVDDLLKGPQDNPSLGIILCRGRNRVVAEYALRDNRKPIGVAAYQLVTALPELLRRDLPSIEVLEAEMVRPARPR